MAEADGANPVLVAEMVMANAVATDAGLVPKCRQCARPLFAAVVRCPFCGERTAAPKPPIIDDSEPGAPTDGIAPPPPPPPEGEVAFEEAQRKRRAGVSKGAITAIAGVVLLIAVLWGSDLVRNNTGEPRQIITVESQWQPLEAPPGARIVGDAPFRLRSGPDVYAIPLGIGVAVPPPAGDEALEVRAAYGAVRLQIYY